MSSAPTVSWPSMWGEPHILNKFACRKKEKWDANKDEWVVKRRLIMDSKRSNVKEASNKEYRSILPRVHDAGNDIMTLLDSATESEQVQMLVLDATEAFWNIPLRACERRFYCGLVRQHGRDRYLTYTRTAQGSRGAPLSWAVVFALICRCALSVLRETRDGTSTLPAAMQVFVDDPWVALLGTPAQCDRMTAVVVLTWRLLGVGLAFAKGQRGDAVDWIGARLSIESSRTLAITIVKARLDELAGLCTQLARKNTVTLKELRSYAGKCQSMATIIYTWRPFVHMLYGAVYSRPSPRLPEHLRYRCQIDAPLAWITAFLHGKKSDLVRVMDVDVHFRRGTNVEIICDASPWGMGAILTIDGRPTEYFAVQTTAQDALQLGLTTTEGSASQQAFEALVLLVALRVWQYTWAKTRCIIHVSSDNMGALSMMCRMQPHSASLGVVAREVALDIADAIYEPQLASHVPGVANVAADALSRKYQPDFQYALPAILQASAEVHPPERTPSWWRSTVPTRKGQHGPKGTVKTPHSSSASSSCMPAHTTRANQSIDDSEFQ